MATIRQKQSTYAITILTFQRKRHFQRAQNADLFIATLLRYRGQGKFLLHAFVVMPDHVHILCTPSIDQTTSRCVQLIKGGYSFALRKDSLGEIWHSRYFDHRVRDAEDFTAQQKYIENNPHRKNYIDYPHIHLAYPNQLDDQPSHFASES